MPKTDCRTGTYPVNGQLIESLRKKTIFGEEKDSFCREPPVFSKTTLARAEASGCIFQTTIVKIAAKLKLPSWKDLLATPDVEPVPVFKDPVLRAITTKHDFDTFDETKDGNKILEGVRLLIAREIPFVVLAFYPTNSVQMIVAFERTDAAELSQLWVDMKRLDIVSFLPAIQIPATASGINLTPDVNTFAIYLEALDEIHLSRFSTPAELAGLVQEELNSPRQQSSDTENPVPDRLRMLSQRPIPKPRTSPTDN